MGALFMVTQAEPLNEYSIDGSGVDDELIQFGDEEVSTETDDHVSQETPEETPESTPQPPTDSDVLSQLRADNARLTREAQQRQREAEQARTQNEALQYAERRVQDYQREGLDDETAKRLAILETKALMGQYQASVAEQRALSLEISQQYGVPIEQLNNFTNEAAMRHYAEQYSNTTGPQAKRIQELEARLASLEKGVVPAQNYNQSGRSGSPRVTSDNADELWIQGKISDAQYRKFIGS